MEEFLPVAGGCCCLRGCNQLAEITEQVMSHVRHCPKPHKNMKIYCSCTKPITHHPSLNYLQVTLAGLICHKRPKAAGSSSME
jgi:hypothetical protein